nr:MAG TPA: hypothetical protein [Caudoviricetes sp.]
MALRREPPQAVRFLPFRQAPLLTAFPPSAGFTSQR